MRHPLPIYTSVLRPCVQVSLCFHSTDTIRLPDWVLEDSRVNPDLYYTDKAGGRNTECLTLGVDDGEGTGHQEHLRCGGRGTAAASGGHSCSTRHQAFSPAAAVCLVFLPHAMQQCILCCKDFLQLRKLSVAA